MGLIAVPNISEGRRFGKITDAIRAIEGAGSRILDVHSDPVHNRTVLTVTSGTEALCASMVRLAQAMSYLDLRTHEGVHPRLGGLDVCPIVPFQGPMTEAVSAAHTIGEGIATRAGLPVYFYGAAARRHETSELPSLRRGGLRALIERANGGLAPDAGPCEIEPQRGVVCVGARITLIAFNVWLESSEATARRIAIRVRTVNGGPPGVRAIGLAMPGPSSGQVSLNLIDPDQTGIVAAFEAVAAAAGEEGAGIAGTEIVGLVPDRYLPAPDEPATRLLMKPVRSLESAVLETLKS
ncbi:MAG: glutamate formiminotransferase [Actinomycetota bacterium]|nr:glutamate formiminotransferase [Actinomycetota bacterium]